MKSPGYEQHAGRDLVARDRFHAVASLRRRGVTVLDTSSAAAHLHVD